MAMKDGRSQFLQRLAVWKTGVSIYFSFRTFKLKVINLSIFSSSLCYSSALLQEDWLRRCCWRVRWDVFCSCFFISLCQWWPKRQWSWLMPTFSLKEAMRDWLTSMKKVLMKRVSEMDACCVLLCCFFGTFSTYLKACSAMILWNTNMSCHKIHNL